MIAHAHAQLIAQVATLVVRWHNRHPLAKRIGPEHVQGIGIVALPFVGAAPVAIQPGAIEPALENAPPLPAAAGSLRERALAVAGSVAEPATAPAQSVPVSGKSWWRFWAGPKRAFSEDFIAPISPARAGSFASGHGASEDPAPGAWPRRDVLVDRQRLKSGPADWRFLRTAAIEIDDRRARVLLAADGTVGVIGPRLWSVPRSAVAAMLPLSIALASVVARIDPSPAQKPAVLAQLPVTVERPAPVVAAAPIASAPMPPASIASASAAAVVPAPVHAAAQAAVATSAPPVHVVQAPPETRADAPRVDIRPRLDPDVARVARRESSALRQSGPSVVSPRAAAKAVAVAPIDEGKTFALVARQTRTRAASEVLLGLMRSAAGTSPPAASRTEVLPSAEGYRASWWPFGSRGDAEQARQRLASVGLPVDLVEF